MDIVIKTFEALSTEELYLILRLRSAVFVVEQNCIYQDIDNKDQQALHVLGIKKNKLVAYTRIFEPGTYFEASAIGRVVVSPDERKHGYGKKIMQTTLKHIETSHEDKTIMLSAQTYLIKFYTELGFTCVGEEYLEDGIPHIRMVRN